jgi:hypothetical protein
VAFFLGLLLWGWGGKLLERQKRRESEGEREGERESGQGRADTFPLTLTLTLVQSGPPVRSVPVRSVRETGPGNEQCAREPNRFPIRNRKTLSLRRGNRFLRPESVFNDSNARQNALRSWREPENSLSRPCCPTDFPEPDGFPSLSSLTGLTPQPFKTLSLSTASTAQARRRPDQTNPAAPHRPHHPSLPGRCLGPIKFLNIAHLVLTAVSLAILQASFDPRPHRRCTLWLRLRLSCWPRLSSGPTSGLPHFTPPHTVHVYPAALMSLSAARCPLTAPPATPAVILDPTRLTLLCASLRALQLRRRMSATVLQQLTPSRASTNDAGSSQATAATSTPNSRATSPNLGHSGHSIVAKRATSPKAPKPRVRPNGLRAGTLTQVAASSPNGTDAASGSGGSPGPSSVSARVPSSGAPPAIELRNTPHSSSLARSLPLAP